ncbi:MAG: R3H domain-containing nucleic acid-binding protein [Patescibacteria group bacterium]
MLKTFPQQKQTIPVKKEISDKVKEIIKILIGKMGVVAEVEENFSLAGIRFSVKTENAGLLIGNNGANLAALNHLAKKIAKKDIVEDDFPQFFLDVNDYLKQKNESLEDLAKMNAQKARYFKKEILMPPMNAYERRVVHSILTEYPDIVTESIGEEPNRRVVIKPYV